MLSFSLVIVVFLLQSIGFVLSEGFLVTTWVGDIGCMSPQYQKREFFDANDVHTCFMIPGSKEVLSAEIYLTHLYTGKTIKVFQVTKYQTIVNCEQNKKGKNVYKIYVSDQPKCDFDEETGVTIEGKIVNSQEFLEQSNLMVNDFMHHVYDGGPTCVITRYILLEKNQASKHEECPATGDCVYHVSIGQSERKMCTFPKGSGGEDDDDDDLATEKRKEIPEAEITPDDLKKKKDVGRNDQNEIVVLISLIGAGVVTLVIGSLLLCLMLTLLWTMVVRGNIMRIEDFLSKFGELMD